MFLEFTAVTDYGIDLTAQVFTRGFSDYLVRIATDAGTLLQMTRCDGVDLTMSRVIVREGAAVGAALIARRGWSSRLAGMALIPEARGLGIGRATMVRLIEEAKARGDRTLVLEVIEQNPPAVRLYESCGFTRMRRLVGFSRNAELSVASSATSGLEDVDPRAVAAAVTEHGGPDLPWQISGETIAHLAPPAVGYHLEGAWLVVSNLATPQPAIRALVVERSQQRKGRGAALLRAVLARHPGKEWRMTALWPEELSQVFFRAGFVRTPLSQWQMMRPAA